MCSESGPFNKRKTGKYAFSFGNMKTWDILAKDKLYTKSAQQSAAPGSVRVVQWPGTDRCLVRKQDAVLSFLTVTEATGRREGLYGLAV